MAACVVSIGWYAFNQRLKIKKKNMKTLSVIIQNFSVEQKPSVKLVNFNMSKMCFFVNLNKKNAI